MDHLGIDEVAGPALKFLQGVGTREQNLELRTVLDLLQIQKIGQLSLKY